MGNFTHTVGELNTMIKKESKLNIAHLGNSDFDYNTYIYGFITLAMWKYVDLAFVAKTTDPLVVSADGYVTFQIDGADIEDLYDTNRILIGDESGSEFTARASFTQSNGWFRESANSRIHIKGAGTYVMQYNGYPAKAVTESQVLEWPAKCYDLLIWETIGKIKESLNDIEGTADAYRKADFLVPSLIKANLDAIAKTNGRRLSMNDMQYYKR